MSQYIPQDVTYILTVLGEYGYDGYIVGGAVRDYMMERQPHDWDIATNARPEQVKEMFSKVIDTGIKHGTVTAMVDGEGYEITTYRCDGLYSDGRHPDSVAFVDTIEADLSRRDFTINAMAMTADGDVVDPFGGLEDLKRGMIRCVGNPDDRFAEDALRMIRAVRFEAQFGFDLDDDLRVSIRKNVEKLQNVSQERISEEFSKMLVSSNPKKGFLDAYATGITGQVLPEFNVLMECEQDQPYHYANVGIHTLDAVQNIRPDRILRWTMLLHDMGKPAVKQRDPRGWDTFFDHPQVSKEIADRIMTRLHFSNKDRCEIDNLVEHHDLVLSRDWKVRAFAAKYGEEYLDKLYEVKTADAHAHSPRFVDALMKQHTDFIMAAKGFLADGTAIKPSDLQINGDELQEYGFQGKAVGEFLRSAYKDCLGNPALNTNELLRKRAARMMERRVQPVTHEMIDMREHQLEEDEPAENQFGE